MSVIKEYTSTGEKDWISTDKDSLAVVIKVDGSATIDVEGTLSSINDKEQVIPFKIQNLTGVTSDTSQSIISSPIKAVRVNILSVSGKVIFQSEGY